MMTRDPPKPTKGNGLPHGWFTIPGVQTGERDIRERVTPLYPLLKFSKGATVLDLGCAEGCIGKWLVDEGGAAFVHGIEKHEPWLEVARQQMPAPKYNAKFSQCDLDYWNAKYRDLGLLQHYDIVLALNVAQKLWAPKHFLHSVAKLSSNIFVYSGPSPVLQDVRSGNIPIDIVKEFETEFELIAQDAGTPNTKKGHLGVRLIFKRKKKRVRK